jgi:ubiquinone/menaquinone biosynthesis C-methylase UbiE
VKGPTNADRYAHPLIPVYSPELYRGTAGYYSRFRPRYPPVLLHAIERTVRLDQGDSLLDLACGTGEVSLALSDRFSDVWAIDLEQEMVAMARQNALDRGIGSIHWLVGRAEDAELPEDHFGLVVVGRAFHRLNRPLIAGRSIRWLRSGGYFIDMGADSSGLFEPSEPWLEAAAEVYERWLPRAHKSRDDVRSSSAPDQPKATSQAVLMEAGFTQVAKYEFPVFYVWEIDQFLGYLCSTSYSSRDFWGEAWPGFELDLRTTLTGLAPTGQLSETISSYFVVGRKPTVVGAGRRSPDRP